MNVDHLKKQAKRLANLYPEILTSNPERLPLAAALDVIAKINGYPGWQELSSKAKSLDQLPASVDPQFHHRFSLDQLPARWSAGGYSRFPSMPWDPTREWRPFVLQILGLAGTGKTSLAAFYAEQLGRQGGSVLYVECLSPTRSTSPSTHGLEANRTTASTFSELVDHVEQFAEAHTGGRSMVIFDEADHLSNANRLDEVALALRERGISSIIVNQGSHLFGCSDAKLILHPYQFHGRPLDVWLKKELGANYELATVPTKARPGLVSGLLMSAGENKRIGFVIPSPD
jgi:hypothetical protein